MHLSMYTVFPSKCYEKYLYFRFIFYFTVFPVALLRMMIVHKMESVILLTEAPVMLLVNNQYSHTLAQEWQIRLTPRVKVRTDRCPEQSHTYRGSFMATNPHLCYSATALPAAVIIVHNSVFATHHPRVQ